MKPYAKVFCSALFFILCIPSIVFADDPSKDPFYTQGVSKDAPPINTVSEHIDPFSGILTLSHTDVHLPGNGGLDLNLMRTYNSMIWGRRDGTSFPGLVAQNERSPLGNGWSMHMGIVRNPAGTGSSNMFLPDNPVVEMPDGSSHTLYRDKNTGNFISKEFWVYKATDSGWQLTLTDGTVYTFEYGTGKAGYDMLGNPVVKVAQATKITNAAGTAAINIGYQYTNG
jgi:hypothetical protein